MIALERLMHRGRQVESPHARLKILDIERPGIIEAVPADYIKRMMIENRFRDCVALLNQQAKLALLVVRTQRFRTPDIALGVGADLGQLPVLVAIAFGRPDVSSALQNQQSDRLLRVAIPM